MYMDIEWAAVPKGRRQKQVMMMMILSLGVRMMQRMSVDQILQRNSAAVEGKSHFLEGLERSNM